LLHMCLVVSRMRLGVLQPPARSVPPRLASPSTPQTVAHCGMGGIAPYHVVERVRVVLGQLVALGGRQALSFGRGRAGRGEPVLPSSLLVAFSPLLPPLLSAPPFHSQTSSERESDQRGANHFSGRSLRNGSSTPGLLSKDLL
jgi:hypothetical protein